MRLRRDGDGFGIKDMRGGGSGDLRRDLWGYLETGALALRFLLMVPFFGFWVIGGVADGVTDGVVVYGVIGDCSRNRQDGKTGLELEVGGRLSLRVLVGEGRSAG